MNMLWSFLHPEDAYDKAEEAANKGYNEAQGYQRPFWQQGQDQYGRLNQAENDLLDPAALQDKWSKGYDTSDFARRLLAQNQTQGLGAASSMGLMGSSAAIGDIQQGAGNIVSKDREQYMKDLMEKYLHGIGIGQNIYGIGANAGADMGGRAMEHGRDTAGLEYGKQAAPGELFGKVAGTALNYFAPGTGNAFTKQPQQQQNNYNPY